MVPMQQNSRFSPIIVCIIALIATSVGHAKTPVDGDERGSEEVGVGSIRADFFDFSGARYIESGGSEQRVCRSYRTPCGAGRRCVGRFGVDLL